jgi:hypothetical protein
LITEGFLDLPRSIAASFSTTARMMQTDIAVIKVFNSDPVQLKDSTAVISSSAANINSYEIAVDGATVISAPSASKYINQLSQTSANESLMAKRLGISLFSLFVSVFVLLI